MSDLYCSTCKQTLPVDSFYICRRSKSGRQSACKVCQKNRKRRPDLRAYARNKNLQRNHGITSADFDALSKSQNYVCAICEDPTSTGVSSLLHVDHDHVTGVIRGLLCHSCNVALGHMKDDPELLRRAAKYLEEN